MLESGDPMDITVMMLSSVVVAMILAGGTGSISFRDSHVPLFLLFTSLIILANANAGLVNAPFLSFTKVKTGFPEPIDCISKSSGYFST